MDCTSVLDFDSQTYRKLWILSGYSCYETNYYVDVEEPGGVELNRQLDITGNFIVRKYSTHLYAFVLVKHTEY